MEWEEDRKNIEEVTEKLEVRWVLSHSYEPDAILSNSKISRWT